ncbi:MAG: YbdK family carboxylate-amine ligase, partial [Streptosporangiaceae bacterium]
EPGIQQELMRFQVETGTRVCTGLDDLGRELIRLRRLAAAAAASLGCRLVASGVAPYRTPGLAAVTDKPRYRELARRYGPVVAEAGTCGCHVHVGVPSREAGVQVLARLRPWLAPLLAVSANSPIAGGHETGWASWRYPIQARWPTAVPPAAWPDAAAYDTAVRRLIGQGAALDERSVYFLARLSPRYPTIEVRVADVCLDAGTAVLLAGLTRALVATALTEARRGTPAAAARPAGDRSQPPASPVHQHRIHARVHHRTRPRDPVRLRARPLASARCPDPGSGRRAVVRYPWWPQYAAMGSQQAIHGGHSASRPQPPRCRRRLDHLRHGKRNVQVHFGGTLPILYPTADDSQFSGLAVFAGSLEEANAIMDADPAVQAACSPTRSIRCSVPDR